MPIQEFDQQMPPSGAMSFVYDSTDPLPSDYIRLLKPIELRQDILSYQLVPFPRSQAPQYTVISYT